MPTETKCPKCQSSNIDDRRAEGNVGAREEGESIPRSGEEGPKYECRKCGHRFDV